MATTQEPTRPSLAPLRLPEMAPPHRDHRPPKVAEAGETPSAGATVASAVASESASALIPPAQELRTASLTESCQSVLGLILDQDFSAVPVIDRSGRVAGMVTAESILEHLRGMAGQSIGVEKIINAPIRNAMGPARYIAPDTFVDLQVDWQDIQHVIPGTSRNPIGILTLSDVWKVLYDFTEAFVLVHGIEIGLRRLILRTIENTGISLETWLAEMHVKAGQVRPQRIGDLAFSQYLYLMYSNTSTSIFEPGLGSRTASRPAIDKVNMIRNEVMHFRHHTVPEAFLATLQKFRLVVHA
jgi:CBS domain-containing protein